MNDYDDGGYDPYEDNGDDFYDTDCGTYDDYADFDPNDGFDDYDQMTAADYE